MKIIRLIVIAIFATSFIACTSENTEKEQTTNNSSAKAEQTATKTAQKVDAQAQVTSVVEEEAQKLKVVDKKGNVQTLEITQPTINKQKMKALTPDKKEISFPKTEVQSSNTSSKVTKTKVTNSTASISKTPSEKPQIEVSSIPVTQPSASFKNGNSNDKITVKSQIKDVEVKVKQPEIQKTTQSSFSHTAWDALLRKHVSSSGKVNYKGFKADQTALDAYTKLLANNPIQDSWSRNKKMAYWINAYNAFTVKMIVDNYPIASITKLDGGKPWDKKWIKLGDKTYSLNNIENDILRPQYKDARIHFAVNCAAKSCPPLLNRAWTADNLEANFEKQAKAFINNSSFNQIDAKSVSISKIFEWYAGDFDNIIEYLNQYSSTPINAKAKVKYLEYDWDLNQ